MIFCFDLYFWVFRGIKDVVIECLWLLLNVCFLLLNVCFFFCFDGDGFFCLVDVIYSSFGFGVFIGCCLWVYWLCGILYLCFWFFGVVVGWIVVCLWVCCGFFVLGNNFFVCVFVLCWIGGVFFLIFDYWDWEDCVLNGLGCGIGCFCFRFVLFCFLNGILV